MIGTDFNGQGGIATVVKVLKSTEFWNRWNIKYISTHSSVNTSKLSAIFQYMNSIFFSDLLSYSK